MTIHSTTLRAREPIAHGTMAFHFDKPAGFAYEAGQAIGLVLPDSATADPQSARHTFSLVSAPFEGKLVVATRMRDSAFKRALGALPIGAGAAVEGPAGSLTLHTDHTRAAVLIAGGIGITPFVGMLRQAAHDRSAQRLVLLYSNRRPEDAAYLRELQALEQRHRHFTMLATMTAISQSIEPWSGLQGPIDEPLLKRAAADLTRPIYYVAGPPAMAEALRQTLNDIGVDDDAIRSEAFYGY